MRDALQPKLEENDGTFWMSFQDFVSHFDSLDVCRVRNWDEIRVRGRFIRFQDESNPQNEVVVSKWFYALDVPKRSHVFITLHQEDERIEGVLPRRPYIDAGIVVLKMDKEQGSILHSFKDYACKREAEIELILEEGSYIFVPRTTGCLLRRPDTAQAENIRLID